MRSGMAGVVSWRCGRCKSEATILFGLYALTCAHCRRMICLFRCLARRESLRQRRVVCRDCALSGAGSAKDL